MAQETLLLVELVAPLLPKDGIAVACQADFVMIAGWIIAGTEMLG